jgi:uncharacterized protein YjbI with pentapeptide repeats
MLVTGEFIHRLHAAHRATVSGVDLSGVDLGGIDLHNADMSNADLRSAKLSGIDLRGAKLNGVDLSGVDLSGADLSNVDLSSTNLSGAKLIGVNLDSTKLTGVDFSNVDLSEAHVIRVDLIGTNLAGANLRDSSVQHVNFTGANLVGADFSKVELVDVDFARANFSDTVLVGVQFAGINLAGANLQNADLRQANLVDACLDGADLTGAKLWGVQCGGWSIKEVSCRFAFWDREDTTATSYEEREFERIYADKPRLRLHYPNSMSTIDLIALPLVLKRLQDEYPNSLLRVRSVQDDAGGALVTIVVDDLADRSKEVFTQELVRLQTELKCVADDREYYRAIFKSILSDGMALLALPRQNIHLERPSGPIAIGGPMTNDTYNISGQAGAVGPGSRAQVNTFQQIQGGIDLPQLADELRRLRDAMKGETTGTPEEDKAIGAGANAGDEAAKGDGTAALRYLKCAGTWALGVAEKIGVAVATEALKRAI